MGTGATVTVTTNNSGTDFDTKLGVFSGTCGSLVCQAANDDIGYGVYYGLTSTVTFTTLAGTQYFIYVTGQSSAFGDFSLSIGPITSAPPVLVNCPADISAYTDMGLCTTYLTIQPPVFGIDYTDDCTAAIINDFTFTDNASSIYPKGVTAVTWTVVDMNGQMSGCIQRVFVDDTNHATLVMPGNIEQVADSGLCQAMITYTNPVINELCPGPATELILNGGFESGSMAPWVETGNNGTSCDVDFNAYTGNSDPCGFGSGLGVDLTPPVGAYAINAGLDGAGPMQRTVQQGFTLPTYIAKAELSFRHAYYVDLLNFCSGCTGTRILDVMFLDDALNVVDTIYHQTFAPGAVYTQNFTLMQFDVKNALESYAGQKVYLNVTLTIPEAFTGPGMYALDDVSLKMNGSEVEQIAGLPSGSAFPVGTTVNVFSATAANGFSIDSVIQTVTVLDTLAPVLCAPVLGIITSDSASSLTGPAFSVLSGGILTGRPNSDGSCCAGYDPATNLLKFSVDVSGAYTIVQHQYGWDGYLLLYTDPFQLNITPPTTFVAGNDDYGSAQDSQLSNVILSAGQNYYLFTTAYSTTYPAGSYKTTFTGPGNVISIINPCQQDVVMSLDSGQCSKVFTYPLPVATDFCSVDTIMLTEGLESGAAFPAGITHVELTAFDPSGNSSTYSFNVSILESTPPVVVAPADVTVPADAGACTASGVALGLPTVTDNCSLVFDISNNAHEPYPLGTTYVTWAVSDESGNTTQAVQKVTVMDMEPPMMAHADTTVVYDSTICGAYVAYIPPVGIEVCKGNYLTQSSAPDTIVMNASVACGMYPDSDTNAFIRIYDLSAYSGEDSVTIGAVRFGIQDAIHPSGAQDVQLNVYSLHGPIAYSNMQPLFTDTLSIINQSLSFVQVPVNLRVATDSIVIEIYSVGTYMDGVGFYIGANNAPETAPSYIATNLCSIPEPTPLALVGVPNVSFLIDVVLEETVVTSLLSGVGAGGLFPVGTTTETYQSTDGEGNTSVLSFDVTVLDTHAPVVICSADTTVSTTSGMCGALVAPRMPNILEHCGIDTLMNNAPAMFPVGTTPLTWTVVDMGGNVTTCVQQITVVDDENPSITCPANVSVPNDPGFSYATNVDLGTPIVDDNCGVANVINNAVEPYPAGTNIVTWIVSDVYGNMSSCAQTVTVNSDIGIAGYEPGGDLLRNDPNPFHDRTTITFYLNQDAEVSMRILDVVGQTVSVMFEGTSMQAGAYTETFDAQAHHMAPGIYYLQMTVNGNRLVSKMMVE